MSTSSLSLAKQIRAAREQANLSQAEAAGELGVSVRTLQAWEAGTTPRPLHRRRVARWLSTTTEAAA